MPDPILGAEVDGNRWKKLTLSSTVSQRHWIDKGYEDTEEEVSNFHSPEVSMVGKGEKRGNDNFFFFLVFLSF